MKSTWKIGIDIGSTTIKTVVLDELDRIVFKQYKRHFSEIYKSLSEDVALLKDKLSDRVFNCTLTGSAGMGLAEAMKVNFVQEVIACTQAVKKWIPRTDAAVELGGEDAKITYFGKSPEQRMNGVCAGGTGSFIDHMAALLHTDAKGLNDLANDGNQIYTIASRCGVFAKTDVQALINDGATKEDIALSIFQAVVNQTIGNLAQGRPIEGNVAFLGGPLHFLPALRERFIKTLKLTGDSIVDTPDGCYFVAMGAALSEDATVLDYKGLLSALELGKNVKVDKDEVPFVLFKDDDDYAEFKKRHAKDIVAKGNLSTYAGPLYIGIDAGSTTTKVVGIGEDKQLLYTSYGSNNGVPLDSVIVALRDLYTKLNDRTYIKTVGTTGYGEYIVKAAVHADFGEVETFAHLRAAQEFCPQVSCVLDIGGQDMKCFFVKDGRIAQIVLNEACSAGCGSFIENFAQGLSMTAADFAQKGLDAQHPVDLGTRCTVFMNSRVKQSQKEGASVADISAGIALSVIKNALFKVIQIKDVKELGDAIVVQGGTFYNDAVLRSMELLLHKDVIRPDISGLMGAYGMALLAMQRKQESSSLLSADSLDGFKAKQTSYRCKRCGNKCLITMQTFPDGGRYFIGNRCERGIGGTKKTEKEVPNIYAYKYKRLFSHYKPLQNAAKGRIGIPRSLNMYEDYPFWFTFFTQLGYEVVLSDESSPELFYKGMATVPSDSLCYPAKLVHGHIMNLLEKGLKTIFYPCIPHNIVDELDKGDSNYNCPVVASYAENIRANMEILQKKNINFLQPFLPINDKKRLYKRLTEELKSLSCTKQDIKNALGRAYEELAHYKEDIASYGNAILQKVREEHLKAIVLCGRPYHIDPEINHGIPEMIQNYGIAVLSEDVLAHLPIEDEHLSIVNQWVYHGRLYHAAQYVSEHPELTLIQLSSFGCGLDAITTGQVKEILERRKCVYTMIKLDEVSNLGSAKIRLRSLMAAWKYGMKEGSATAAPIPQRAYFSEECQKHTILAPQMSPLHFELIKAAVIKHGYDVEIPPMPTQAAVDEGLRYVNNDMCYPAIIVIGQLLYALKSGKYDINNTSIMLFQTCGACRATNYLNLMRKALRDAGMPQVPVFACWGRDTDSFKMGADLAVDVLKSTIYADLLQKVRNRTLPYERDKGSVEALFRSSMNLCKEDLGNTNGSYSRFAKNIKKIVNDFDNIALEDDQSKPRIGIVGEILAKYHPTANNHLEKVLYEEGAEVVMPDLMDFFMYMAYDDIISYKLLTGKWMDKFKSEIAINLMEFYRRPMRKALKASKRFTPPYTIKQIAKLTDGHVSLGNMAGEGWFLTGEMLKLLTENVKNIVCLQPFGCLPNHITGKGMIRELLRSDSEANIVAIDCDASVSEVNQLNRIKLMLSVAKEHLRKDVIA